MKTRKGVVAHVQADPNMSEESAVALEELIDAAHERLTEIRRHQEQTVLDD
jgi:hypothetical protein